MVFFVFLVCLCVPLFFLCFFLFLGVFLLGLRRTLRALIYIVNIPILINPKNAGRT